MKQHENTIVDDHRNMLQVSKKISKFQEENLKSWVFICFDDVKKVDVSWDFIRKNKSEDFFAGKIVFNITFEKNKTPSNDIAQKAADWLEGCTKFLFWSETKVTIKKGGKKWKMEN